MNTEQQPLFLSPAFREKIWGGNYIFDHFHLETPSDHTGEAWIISAYPNDESHITAPETFKGMGLEAFYQLHPEYFGEPHPKRFPLLVKILDAKENLSVQVHPGDDYALKHENDLGKTESWYILDAKPDATLVYGHNAKTKEEFDQLIEDGNWDQLLRHVHIKPDDFYYVPSGTIHALEAGTVVLETQQSSDVTYRVYDYDRPDQNGQLRPLHLEQSKAVTTIPNQEPDVKPVVQEFGESQVTTLVEANYFTVMKVDVKEAMILPLPANYYLGTVIKGEGTMMVDEIPYDLGLAQSFILPNQLDRVTFDGEMTLILSHPNFTEKLK
ncbi:MAG: mannose-6-phosphate isomerase, class I [Aerococcus sp.]|nr:mannose-6-phosphate isomerase, class I [Aerococcus sp.]